MKFQIKLEKYKFIGDALDQLLLSEEESDKLVGKFDKMFPEDEIALEFDTETPTVTIIK